MTEQRQYMDGRELDPELDRLTDQKLVKVMAEAGRNGQYARATDCYNILNHRNIHGAQK